MRQLVSDAGLGDSISIDSAGTAAYHEGESPDRRSAGAALKRGVKLLGKARQFSDRDWQHFDYVVAMDRANFDDLVQRAPSKAWLSKLRLLLEFDPNSAPGASVPDPYYGGEGGFDLVLDLCFAGCRGLLTQIRETHQL